MQVPGRVQVCPVTAKHPELECLGIRHCKDQDSARRKSGGCRIQKRPRVYEMLEYVPSHYDVRRRYFSDCRCLIAAANGLYSDPTRKKFAARRIHLYGFNGEACTLCK